MRKRANVAVSVRGGYVGSLMHYWRLLDRFEIKRRQEGEAFGDRTYACELPGQSSRSGLVLPRGSGPECGVRRTKTLVYVELPALWRSDRVTSCIYLEAVKIVA
jgi:hypothetical protein